MQLEIKGRQQCVEKLRLLKPMTMQLRTRSGRWQDDRNYVARYLQMTFCELWLIFDR